MTFEEMLKIWAHIEAMPELEAKLAFFGLIFNDLGRQGVTLDEAEVDKVLDWLNAQQDMMRQASGN